MRSSQYYASIFACFLSQRNLLVEAGNIFLESLIQAQQVDEDECQGIKTVPSFPYTIGVSAIKDDFRNPAKALIVQNNGNRCNIQDMEAPGHWYKIKGNNRFLKAMVETSEISTGQKVGLFQGNKCLPEECIFTDFYHHNQLDWFAEEGSTYFFKVFDDSSSIDQSRPSESGLFVLKMEEYDVQRPENDMCSTARRLQAGHVVEGSSTGAHPHGLVNLECSLQAHSRGLFYTVEGTGEPVKVSLRPDVSEGRMEIAVLSQDDCGNCIARSDFINAEDAKHTITFDSVIGETYTVAISGEGVSDAGVFQLTLESEEDLSISSGGGFPATYYDLAIASILIMLLAL